MLKTTVNINFLDFQSLIDQLTIREKLVLVKKLEKETIATRLSNIFKKIDQRRKKYPISQKEIKKEILAVRKKFYD